MATHAQALFLHDRMLAALSDVSERELERRLAEARTITFSEDSARIAVVERFVGNVVDTSSISPLDAAYFKGLTPGALVFTTQDWYFKEVDDVEREFHAPLRVDPRVRLIGRFSVGRIVGQTGQTELRNHKTLSMVGVVEEVGRDEIRLRPAFIGWLREGADSFSPMHDGDARRLWPRDIDQFASVDWANPGRNSPYEYLEDVSESDVKTRIAGILGEPFIPKDWGGERSDLVSSVTVNGVPHSIAFAFKGPGKRAKILQPRDMGTNGDQGIRLFEEPVDICVVQYYRDIAMSVHRLMRALALAESRRWMVLDGRDTAAILAAYGVFPESLDAEDSGARGG